MCGRFTQFFTWHEVWELSQPFWQPAPVPSGSPRRYNVAPTQQVQLLRAGAEGAAALVEMQWGIPRYEQGEKRGVTINARTEGAHERRMFAEALSRRRCLVPASTFYEWTKPGDGTREPWCLSPAGGGPFLFAGLWNPTNEGDAFAIMTLPASNPIAANLHHRVPCVIAPGDGGAWLSPERTKPDDVKALIRPFGGADAKPSAAPGLAESIEAWPVSPRVNRADAQGADLIAPVEAQGSLFG